MEDNKNKLVGVGCSGSGGSVGIPSAYEFIAAGSPTLALASCKGAIWQRRIWTIQATLTSGTAGVPTGFVSFTGQDQIIQDTYITGTTFNVINGGSANATTWSNLDDFFYNYQGGIAATLEVTGNSGQGYAVAPDYTPLPLIGSVVSDRFGPPFVLIFTQSMRMQFVPLITIPTAKLPLIVNVAFTSYIPVGREWIGQRLSNKNAIQQLKDCGYTVSDACEATCCARDGNG